jgi:hypothetical protein
MVKYNTVNMKYISATQFYFMQPYDLHCLHMKILQLYNFRIEMVCPKSAFRSNCDSLLSLHILMLPDLKP